MKLDNAITFFNEFDWRKEFEEIEKREEKNLTSSYPAFVLQNTDINERLSIIGTQRDEYEIIYEKNGKIGFEYISEDITKNPNGNSVQDIIIALFEQELEGKDEFQEEEIRKEIEIGKYNPLRYLSPILAFFFPIILFTILYLLADDKKELFDVLFYVFGFLTLLNSPFIIILLQYLSKPKVKSIILQNDTKSLQINYLDSNLLIKKKDIHQISYTYCDNGRIPWNSYASISIILKNKEQHYLTTITFTREELEFILEMISMHTYRFETSFQLLRTKDYSEKNKIYSQNIVDGKDLEVLYAEYSNEKLKEIIENKEDYQPIAYEVASKEMARRKDKNFC